VRRLLGDFPGAVEAHEQARRISPSYPTYHTALAGAQAQGGDLEAALVSYEALRNRFPDQMVTAMLEHQLAVRLWRQLRTREAHEIGRRARAYFERAHEENPEDPVPMGQLAALLNDVFREHDAAIELFEKAHEQQPGDLALLANLGVSHTTKGDVAGAIECWSEIEERFPDSPYGPRRLGFAYRRLGRIEESLQAFLRLEKLAPRLSEGAYQVGWSLMVLGRWTEALERFRRVLELDATGTADAFSSSWASFHLGMTELCEGRTESGIEHLRRYHARALWRDGWRYPEEGWEGDLARIVSLAGRLDGFESGGALPEDERERILLALIADEMQRDALAGRVYEATLDADPGAGHRFCPYPNPGFFVGSAASFAAETAAGAPRGADLGGEERARWRRRAVEWLHAALAGWRRLLEERGDFGPKDVVGALENLRSTFSFASIREEERLARLPEEERRACRELWRAVDEFEAELRNLR
jgi:tetratricopeptide (TPR) repeat protein